MKKRINAKRLCLLAAFTAVIIFTMTAASCFGGNKPYVSRTDDNASYTLSFMDYKGKASTNPQEGDAYTLKIEYPNKDVLTSAGTIANVNVSNGELKLTPAGGSETLTVTIDPAGSLTGIKGNFGLPGGSALSLSLSEGELTSVTNGAPPVDPDSVDVGGILGFLSGLFGGKGAGGAPASPPASAESGAVSSSGNSASSSASSSSASGARSSGRSGNEPKLTVSGLPNGDFAVYVFPRDTNLSNFISIGLAVASQSMVAAGGRQEGTPNTFTMILWDERYISEVIGTALRDEDIPEDFSFWNGSGTYQTLLLTAGEDVNPLGMYKITNINFSNGSANARYSDFKDVGFGF